MKVDFDLMLANVLKGIGDRQLIGEIQPPNVNDRISQASVAIVACFSERVMIGLDFDRARAASYAERRPDLARILTVDADGVVRCGAALIVSVGCSRRVEIPEFTIARRLSTESSKESVSAWAWPGW